MFLLFLFFLLCTGNQVTYAANQTHDNVQEIMTLLASGAGKDYIGEPISQLEHALQCAQLAKNAHADEATIIAALLHDIGHLAGDGNQESMKGYGVVGHEKIGAYYVLERGFPAKVAELINGHVAAKRYLTYADHQYYEKLSAASKETLKMQGGPMLAQEAQAFEHDPLFEQKLMMRYWDEQAKEVDCVVDPLESYRELLQKNIQKKGNTDA